ncbi:hypothetical protein DCC62_17260 [candidate division KSB1 bacterium]|nr:MAG: hypothetical protein DCC62_17260 [candidate division KSB1 bacterium]
MLVNSVSPNRPPAAFVLAFVLLIICFEQDVAALTNTGSSRSASAADSSRASEIPVFTPRLGKQVRPPRAFTAFYELAHPRVGLALSGGGSRCLVHIGVLQALEENHIQIDLIVGTSMGSILGGLYAAGYSARQLRDVALQLDWDTLMQDEPSRRDLLLSQKQDRDRTYLQLRLRGWQPVLPRALTAGQKLQSVLTELTLKANYWANSSYDNLRIPFRAMATDVYSGKEIVIDRGDLAEAMCASAAIPFLLSPVPRQDLLLVDGGLLNNIPVDVVRRMGMEIVIAVDATSNLRAKDNLTAPWEFADQVTTIMQQEHNLAQARAADVLISFKNDPRHSLDFTNPDSLIQAGYEQTLAQMDRIRKLCANAQQEANDSSDALFTVHHVDLPDNGAAESRLILQAGSNGVARMLSAAQIQAEVDDLYAGGDYREVRAVLQRDTLRFEAQKNPIIRSVQFTGNTVYSAALLFDCLQTRLGRALNHKRGQQDLTNVVEKYRQDGYALAEIRSVSFEEATGALTIEVDEGRIVDLVIEGLHRTQEFVVLREFSLEAGEIFNSNIAREGVDRLHNTGIFEKASYSLLRLPSGGALVKIKVEEKPSTIVRLGGFHESERGSRVFTEIGTENLLGGGNKLFVHGNLGERDQVARLSWRADRIARTYLTLSTSLYHERRNNVTYVPGRAMPLGEYADRRAGMRATLGQQVSRWGGLAVEFRTEEVRLRSISGSGYPVGTSRFNSIAVRSILDTRDRFLFTRTGRFLNVSYEYFKPYHGTSASFSKFQAQVESFDSIGPHTLHYRLTGGTAEENTPFYEQFKLGGPHEIYGLRDQEFVGRHLVLGSIEYRYQLRKRPWLDTYISLRYDWGGVWVDRRDTSYRKIRNGAGIALALDTPLGPFGVAFGLFEGRQKRVYVQLGHAF